MYISTSKHDVSIFLLTSSIRKMEPSDWLNTKIGITYERFEIGSWFWARWKVLLFPFPRYMILIPKNSFLTFRKFGHVTDDVIILTCVQNFGKILWPKCCLIHFRKSHGGLVRQYIRFLSIISMFSRGAYYIFLKQPCLTHNFLKKYDIPIVTFYEKNLFDGFNWWI